MPRGGSKPGERRGGRQAGTPNRITRVVREAIVLAAEAEGSDGRGRGKLVGYLRTLARDHPSVFGPLIGRIVPHEVSGSLAVSSHEEALEQLERAARGET